MIRVVIADDHHLVREGIRALLEKAGDIVVVAEAVDGVEAVERVRALAPDVAVLDIEMPRLNGILALEQIADLAGACQVVILSMYSDEALVRHALRSGARGFVLKGSVFEELLLAIRSANRGATYLSPAVSDRLLREPLITMRNGRVSGHVSLTKREIEVVRLIGEGRTNREIGGVIGISIKTVERHRTNLMAKLGAHNIVELVRIALKKGLIQLDS